MRLFACAVLLVHHTASAGPVSAADCVAHAEAVVVHGDARFTVLTDRVVRAERAPFVDECTFTVVRRAMPSVPQFTHAVRADGVLEINTTQLRLVYNAAAAAATPSLTPRASPPGGGGGGGGGGFSAASLSINAWRPGMADVGNLGGTISSWNEVHPRSLLNGTQTYQTGVLSRSGWAVVDDTATPRFSFEPPLWQGTQPWYAPAKANATQGGPGRTDLYFFGCGVDHKACLKDFVALSGPVPMPPLATFGVWWSHYETYSEQSIKSDVLEKFVEYGCVLILSATFSSKMPLCSL
jgi:alpha-glucosidase